MAEKRFAYQPAWVDFIIFWALIVTGVAIAVILQMENQGYAGVSVLPVVVLAVFLALGALQVWRTRLRLTESTITFGRLLPASSLTMAWSDISAVHVAGHTLTFTTRQYGRLVVERLNKQAPLIAALRAHGLTVVVAPSRKEH